MKQLKIPEMHHIINMLSIHCANKVMHGHAFLDYIIPVYCATYHADS